MTAAVAAPAAPAHGPGPTAPRADVDSDAPRATGTASRGTVSWTFDNMAEAAAIGRGEMAGPGPVGSSDLAQGYPQLLQTLTDLDLRCTFFIEGWNGLHHPRAVADLLERGHEVGVHGWVHEVWSALSPHDEERLLLDSLQALRLAGTEPSSFRAPGGARTGSTSRLLTHHGLHVDSSLTTNGFDEPAHVGHDEHLTHVPYRWPQVDGYYYLHRHGPDPFPERTLHEVWRQLLLDTATTGGHITFIAHACMSAAQPQRLDVLRDLLDLSLALGLRHLTVTQAARHFTPTPGLAPQPGAAAGA